MPITRQQILQLFSSLWLPKVASVIILALFSWWAVVNVLPLFDEEEIIIAPKTVVKISKVPTKTSLQNINIFGTLETTESKKNKEAKPTKLNLTLRGILATDDPKQGIAQIQNTNQNEQHFAVNDSVFGLATLEEVHIDKVILLHNGRYETLLLPEEFLNVKHFSAEQHKLDQKKIATDYRKLFLDSDTEALRKLFGFDTAWKNGGFAGFIVKALSEKGSEMMATFGVEDGDLITVVNGLRFSEDIKASQQLTELKTATSVDIIIERNGQEIPLHIEFDAPLEEISAVSGNNRQQSGAPADVENGTATDAPNAYSAGTYSGNTGTSSGSSSSSQSAAATKTKNNEPKKTFAEKEGYEEYIRMQRERTIAPAAPVEYDH